MAQRFGALGHWLLFQRTSVQFPEATWWLVTANCFCSGGSNMLIQTYRQNTSAYRIKIT